MVEEYDSIIRNNVWEVVPRPADKSMVSSRWLYKVKQEVYGTVEKHKAGFVVRGLSQVEGIDYEEEFSPIARLKQAPRAWYARIDSYFTRLGFTTSEVDENIYRIVVEDTLLIIVLSVDGLILTGVEKLVKSCKEDIAREFKMKDLGLMHSFLGMEVWQGYEELFVSQGKYVNEILKKFHMGSSKPMETPLARNWRKEDATSSEVVEATIYKKLVGSLMYLVNTRLEICFAVNHLNKEMVKPTKLYWKATKHVLRYLKGTTQFGFWYSRTEGVKLQGFIDADWVGIPSDRERTSGGICSIGSVVVSWYNRKRRSAALSSTEAEYMVASQAACEAI
eukprot:PITA_22324